MTQPMPEPFKGRQIEGYATDKVAVGKSGEQVALVLQLEDQDADGEVTLIFQTSPAGARQLAASLLNIADELDDPYMGRT